MSALQIEIGGRQISIGKLGCIDALNVQVAIASVTGGPLFSAIVGNETDLNSDARKAAIFLALGKVAEHISPEKLISTMETVFKCVTIDGKRINSIDESFSGRNKEVWQVFIAALKENFADFLPEGLLTSA